MSIEPTKFLSPLEMRLLKDAQQYIIDGIKLRSTAPASFRANINCLEKFMYGVEIMIQVMQPHFEKRDFAEKARNNSSNACWAFFGKRHQNTVLYETQIIEDIKKYVMNQELQTMMKNELSKEPRIINLDSKYKKIRNNEITKIVQTGQILSASSNEKQVYTYIITFSDDSTIILNNLEPESLSSAKIIFEEKMTRLA